MGSILSRLAVLNDLSKEVSTIYELERQVSALAKQILIELDSPAASSMIDHLQSSEDLYQPPDAPVHQQLRLLLEALVAYRV